MAWAEQIRAAGMGPTLATVLGAYVLGCFATGYLLVRARTGRDIRDFESGSTGARNVGRLLGKTGFFLTLAGDFGKGALAVWASVRFTENPALVILALLAVVAGHIWPAPLHFHGGKGVATSLGALLVFDWRLAVAYAVCFVIGLAVVRKTTVPGLAAFLSLPFTSWWLNRDAATATALCVLAAMVLFAHRRNIIEEFPALDERRDATAKSHPPSHE